MKLNKNNWNEDTGVRRMVLILLLCFVSSGVFGERFSISPTKNKNSSQTIELDITKGMGCIDLKLSTIEFTSGTSNTSKWTPDYAIVMIGEDYNYNPYTTEVYSDFNRANYINAYKNERSLEVNGGNIDDYNISSIKFYNDEIFNIAQPNFKCVVPSSFSNFTKKLSSQKFTIKIDADTVSKDFIFSYRINGNPNLIRTLKISFTNEYFEGEKAYANKLENMSNKMKRVYLFKNLFYDIETNDYNKNALKDYSNMINKIGYYNANNVDLLVKNNNFSDEDRIDIYGKLKKYIGMNINSSLKEIIGDGYYAKSSDFYNKMKIPFINIDGKGMKDLYKNEIDIYLKAYFDYCFFQNKPVVSKVLSNNLKKRNLNYNYKNYKRVSLAEGKRIAEAAKKYLLWGVEYPAYLGKYGSKGIYLEVNRVLSDNSDDINSWINNSTSNRGDNYFNGIQTDNTGLMSKNVFKSPDKELSDEEFALLEELDDDTFLQLNFDYFVDDYWGNEQVFTNPFGAVGNPLPFSYMGIDSPKTFNYKMFKQKEAKDYFLDYLLKNPDDFKEDSDKFEPKWKTRFKLLRNWDKFYNSVYQDQVNLVEKDYFFGQLREVDIFALFYPKKMFIKNVNYELNNNFEYNEKAEYINLFSNSSLDALKVFGQNDFYKPYATSNHVRLKKANFFDKNYFKNQGPYMPNKVAGVDMLGLLSGALSTANIDIYDLTNLNTPQILDGYYKMQSGTTEYVDPKNGNKKTYLNGLDKYGKPSYYNFEGKESGSSSYLCTKYRLELEDIQKTTVLVPDFKLIQPGDIVIKYPDGNIDKHNEEVEIGIIISMPKDSQGQEIDIINTYYDENIKESDLYNCLVLSTSSEFRFVTLGRLRVDENSNVFNGFSAKNDGYKYQIRRFLTAVDSADFSSDYIDDKWEAIDTRISDYCVDINFLADEFDSRWIPNTKKSYNNNEEMEIAYIPSIKFKASTFTGRVDLNEKSVSIMPPEDQYWEDGNKDNSDNITNNRGRSIEFLAVSKDGKNIQEHIVLAQFKNQKDSKYASVITNLLTENGDTKHKLTIDATGNLSYSGAFNSTSFGVRVTSEAGEKIYFGNDYLLRFKINDYPSLDFKADDSDFVATYDKKLLWRANLYIKEDHSDWNDLHPWTIGNEWNKQYDFDKLLNICDTDNTNFSINTLVDGDGTQSCLDIHSATYCYRRDNDLKVTNKMAYNLQGHDSPFEYNFKLDNQLAFTSNYFTDRAVFEENSVKEGEKWNKHGAPNGDHSNYMHQKAMYLQKKISSGTVGNYKNDMDSDAKIFHSDYLEIDSKRHYPYLPSLSNSIMGLYSNSLNSYPKPNTGGYGAGTDCIGFTERSASYANNDYTWLNIGTVMWGESRDTTSYPYLDEYSTLICKRYTKIVKNKTVSDKEKIKEMLKYAVPGDMIFWCKTGYNGTSKGIHIMMVNSIKPNAKVGEGYELIESTYFKNKNGDYFGSVRLGKKISSLTAEHNFYLVRLDRN